MTTSSGPLARRLANGDTLLGLIVKMPNTTTIELAGHTGFDLVVIDTEHGTATSTELEHHLRAADSTAIPTLVRVGTNDPLLILRALDAGAAGVIVPHVTTADDARRAVDAAHYPPAGHRGLAVSTRAGRHGTTTVHQHLANAADTIVIAQIEDAEGVKNSTDIATTDHINAVWIGPTDLSLALGHPGHPGHPDVTAAIDDIASTVLATPTCHLCVLAESPNHAADWRQRGARILLFNSTALLADALHGTTAKLRTQLQPTPR